MTLSEQRIAEVQQRLGLERMQGWFGRTAQDLIAQGIISE